MFLGNQDRHKPSSFQLTFDYDEKKSYLLKSYHNIRWRFKGSLDGCFDYFSNSEYCLVQV